MIKVLDEQANIKIDGKWVTLKAVLVAKRGGKTVVYIDSEGNEVHKEPLCRSQFKGIKLD
ncbi:Hypothetical protein DPCES_1641 [Desulfitobacterium hafniense]|uniref:Uncharacterized protein n=1 Tax=Desulfitobacterium hafniense TaxID=49338 RepID=A0A098AY29_DESHA|nr:hypothetical protein [Desulfitobacterium hafniense]CDX01528.1 Hypothetical protein DPCES_1641 [Desulfitobacterium hafniense]